jgi:hypothetical protein
LDCRIPDGRIPGAPRLAIAEDVFKPNPHLPRPALEDCVGNTALREESEVIAQAHQREHQAREA